jgi:hypothetical protein
MRDEHLERLYDHLHTNGMGRGGAGRNRDWRAFFKAFLLFFPILHTLFAKLRYMHYGIVW